ncbi:hypothetical protein [Frondihabitans sp. 762G35]|uniref:hypothetical protein n=1 Tax=Frondihabitans sp. 762G35 TaxID=1446794 RepID=UPI0013DC83D6|nr:hypothetical protein [Frondihabitans sp. 762G35]
MSTHLLCPRGHPSPTGSAPESPNGVEVLDIVYLLVVAAVFAVIALVATGVEKL